MRSVATVSKINRGTNLRAGYDGVRAHHTIGVILADLGDQECAHTGTSTTTQGVGDLETLQGVATLRLLSDDVENLVYQLSTLSVIWEPCIVRVISKFEIKERVEDSNVTYGP